MLTNFTDQPRFWFDLPTGGSRAYRLGDWMKSNALDEVRAIRIPPRSEDIERVAKVAV